MLNYVDMKKNANGINTMNKLMLSSLGAMDISAINDAGKILSKSVASIMAFQQPIISESLMNVVKNMQYLMPSFQAEVSNILSSDSLQYLLDSIKPSLDIIKANSAIVMNNYAEMLRGLDDLGCNVSFWAEQAYDEAEEISDDFSTNEEIIEAFEEQEKNPIGFQERFANWTEKKKKKYCIIVAILCLIWTNFIEPYVQDNIGKPITAYAVSKVRELPETASKIIDVMKEGIDGVITEDVPYYYKVTYMDEEGNEKEGYVAKKNLRIIEESDKEKPSDEMQD